MGEGGKEKSREAGREGVRKGYIQQKEKELWHVYQNHL